VDEKGGQGHEKTVRLGVGTPNAGRSQLGRAFGASEKSGAKKQTRKSRNLGVVVVSKKPVSLKFRGSF